MTAERSGVTDGGTAVAGEVETPAGTGAGTEPGAGTGERLAESNRETTTESRSLVRTAGYVVLAFAAVGVGFGLAANFTIGFLIETFVEPGANPLDNTLVGVVLIVSVVNTMLLGPVMAGVSGLVVGRSFPDRRVLSAVFNGTTTVVGFYLLAGLALFVAFSVLSQYAPAGAGAGAGGAGGASGGPFSPADLVPTIAEVGIPTGVVGAVAGYVGSRLG